MILSATSCSVEGTVESGDNKFEFIISAYCDRLCVDVRPINGHKLEISSEYGAGASCVHNACNEDGVTVYIENQGAKT